MTPDDIAAESQESHDSDDDLDAGDAAEPSKRGNRTRRKLANKLDEDVELSGQVDLMLGRTEPGRHRFSLRGGSISDRGGPAKDVLDLVNRLVRSVEGVFPEANPFIEQLAPTNSIQVSFYAPEAEMKQAALRRKKVGEDDPGALGLPDTSIAVLALSAVFAQEDPEQAAQAARSLGVTPSKAIRDLATTLGDTGVELDVHDVADEPVRVTPKRAIRIAEQLDVAAELPTVTVSVAGVLQGVNSGGEGQFEIVTDPDLPLDTAFGRRKNPGDTIRGELSPTARREIKKGSLWDTHVEADVQVVRTQKGRSTRVEGIRLMSARPRFKD